MAEVTTTLVVQFQVAGGAGSVLTAEIDSRSDGFNGGKTSFGPGDQPVFLVFKTADVTIQSVVPTAGQVQLLGPGSYRVEQDLEFTTEKQARLTKPINGSFLSTKWLGRSLGALQLQGQTGVSVTGAPPGVNRVTYNSQYLAYRLNSVPHPLAGEASFPVVVLITGTAPDG